ncbi:zinc finger MYM-type protein 1-like [Rosa chinensis]|uniref:zinc finger MYM-type protein 1-like n=1 Tax=Rosa chinensis TaxID=74649 RepID=UPI000D0925CB|nr:zinc finger MYM-type protein 1-like [Rosa chinensis]
MVLMQLRCGQRRPISPTRNPDFSEGANDVVRLQVGSEASRFSSPAKSESNGYGSVLKELPELEEARWQGLVAVYGCWAHANHRFSLGLGRMSTQKTLDKWFTKRKTPENSESSAALPQSDVETQEPENPAKFSRTEINEIEIDSLERDPGKRPQIWEYHPNLQDEVRRAYIKLGPYQPLLSTYPQKGKRNRSFQSSWYPLFSSWLEYSPTEDKAFCLPCFLFNKPTGHPGHKAFTIEGFQSWKKVRDGKGCAFLSHMGKDSNSFHKNAVRACDDLMKQPQHIQKVVANYTSKQIADNRLRVKTSIEAVRWLAFQGCAFRGHDESLDSINPGNFVKLLELLASYNEKVAEVILQNAPRNASYTSPKIQKQMLQAFSVQIKKAIREEINYSKFCIIVDEARDESKKEQMAIVLRFVDKDGFIRERFFGLVHVSDTKASTLQKGIYSVLSNHNLDIQNIRGQGYDGASNMRGEWNGLQALILKDCPYAYYVHCLAHRLQLALVAASREVIPIQKFFTKLTFIVNILGASCKCNDEFQSAQAEEIAYLTSIDELETGRGLNQIGTLQRAGDTRWSSHFRSISTLRQRFSPTCQVLMNIIEEGKSPQAGDADSA